LAIDDSSVVSGNYLPETFLNSSIKKRQKYSCIPKMSGEWDLKILCMGAGYVGGPTMAVIAKQCPKVRYEVT
jgi:hypothetical protein